MSLLFWLHEGDPRQLLVAALFLTVSALMKVEGLVWAALFVPSLLLAEKRHRARLFGLIGLLAVSAGLVWVIGGVEMEIPAIGRLSLALEQIEVPYLGIWSFGYSNSWGAMRDHLFLFGSWHLLAYLVVLAAGWRVSRAWKQPSKVYQRVGDGIVISVGLILFILFFWTEASRWATHGTYVNRAFLHFAPILTFWMMSIWTGTPSAQATTHDVSDGTDASPTLGRSTGCKEALF
jgi:hypothetical protein